MIYWFSIWGICPALCFEQARLAIRVLPEQQTYVVSIMTYHCSSITHLLQSMTKEKIYRLLSTFQKYEVDSLLRYSAVLLLKIMLIWWTFWWKLCWCACEACVPLQIRALIFFLFVLSPNSPLIIQPYLTFVEVTPLTFLHAVSKIPALMYACIWTHTPVAFDFHDQLEYVTSFALISNRKNLRLEHRSADSLISRPT